MSDLQSLFEGAELSVEFKEKAEVIFASVVESKVTEATAAIELKLQEEFNAKVETKLQELEEASDAYIAEEVMPSVDKYLTAAAAEWLKENTVALEAAGKVSLAESFLTGLTGLAADHRLTLPEGQDQLVVLQTKVDELDEKAKGLLDANIELQKENIEYKKSQVVVGVVAALSEAQKEKLETPFSKVEFKDEAQYAAALKSLAESYFPVGGEVIDEAAKLEKEKQDKAAAKALSEVNLSREDAYYKAIGNKLNS
jgi:hypothetical protein